MPVTGKDFVILRAFALRTHPPDIQECKRYKFFLVVESTAKFATARSDRIAPRGAIRSTSRNVDDALNLVLPQRLCNSPANSVCCNVTLGPALHHNTYEPLKYLHGDVGSITTESFVTSSVTGCIFRIHAKIQAQPERRAARQKSRWAVDWDEGRCAVSRYCHW